MFKRIALAALAIGLTLNGLRMLFDPATWYTMLESVPHTGPFNAHFVRDIGCAYIAAGIGFALGAWRPAWALPAGIVALGFLGLHGAVHVWEGIIHTEAAVHSGVIDLAGVFSPVVFGVLLLIPWRTRT